MKGGMKILALGDLHLGAGPDFRLADQERVLDQITDLARECDGVVFAGDAFHRRRPAPHEERIWRDFVGSLDAPLVAIAGNHDVVAPDLTAAFELPLAENYMAVRTPYVVEHMIPGVSVACLPWTPVSHLVAARGGGDRDQVNQDAAELLVETARGLREQCDAGKPAILVAHWSVSGFSLPNGLPVDQLREPILPLDALGEQDWAAVVLGHIHPPEIKFLGTGCAFYVGSPALVDWGECGFWHGVWTMDFDATELLRQPDTHILTDRSFLTLTLDEVAEEIDVTDACVRVRGQVSADAARSIDQGALRRALLDAGAKTVQIQLDVEREDRARVEGVDESVDEMEALLAYCSANEVPDLLAEQMGERTTTYLEEVQA